MSKSTTITTSTTEIPLHRLSSTRYTPSLFSTSSTLPPSYATSIASTTRDLLLSNSSPFKPTSILQIQSVGKDLVSLPTSGKELCIPIFACDEAGKTDRPKWLSIRPTRKSGSCYLVDAEDETQTPIARTTYRFGPGRPPVVRIGKDGDGEGFVESDEEYVVDADCGHDNKSDSKFISHVDDHGKKSDSKTTARITPVDSPTGSASASTSQPSNNSAAAEEFQMTSKRFLGRTIEFTSPRYGTFEWRYCSRKEKSSFLSTPSSTSVTEKPSNLLVLEKVFKDVDEKGRESECGRVRVAQLIRSDETRTPGSRGGSAGNGGRLELCLERVAAGDAGEGEGEKEILVDEATVVTTVMVMLKKEIDRLRGAQIAVMSAAASG